jgi:hypothetical protein
MMKLHDALRLRDEKREKLKGKPFNPKNPEWEIKDVIVSNKKYAADIYRIMYDRGLTNEFAIKLFKIKENHQWPFGNKELLVASIDGYLKPALSEPPKE